MLTYKKTIKCARVEKYKMAIPNTKKKIQKNKEMKQNTCLSS